MKHIFQHFEIITTDITDFYQQYPDNYLHYNCVINEVIGNTANMELNTMHNKY